MRKRLVPLVFAALAGLTVVTAPELVFAQQSQPSEQDIAQARQLGGQAQAAHDAGNFAEAEKLWAAARNLYPVAPTLSLGLARTQAKLGKYVNAQENYNRIIREWGNNASPPPAFAAAVEAAKAEVGAMSAKVANVVIALEGGAKDPIVTIDGNPVPVAALGLKRPVDPGEHKVHAEAPGYKPADATFSVTEGGNAEARLKLEKDPNAAVVPPAGGTPVAGNPGDPNGGSMSGDTNKGGGGKTLAIVALGVGGVGLVVGAVTGLMAMGKASDLDGKCPDGKCDSTKNPDIQSDVDSYKTLGTISTIGFVVGVVGVGAGVILWVTAPKESAAAKGSRYATVPVKTKPDGVKVTPVIGLGSLGLSGTF